MELENILSEVTQTDMYSNKRILEKKKKKKKLQNSQDTVHKTQKTQQAEVSK
jgi:SUMO ligase MMS21 Smc5/6 complex component